MMHTETNPQDPTDAELSVLIAAASDLENRIRRTRVTHKWAELSLRYAADAAGAASEVVCHLRAARHNQGASLVKESPNAAPA